MKCAIITGASKGLGRSLVKAFLYSSYYVVGIARSKESPFEQKDINTSSYFFLEWDLTQLDTLESLVKEIIQRIPKAVDTVIFIHNAGIMEPVKEIRHLNRNEVEYHFLLNTISPILLTSAWLRYCSQAFSRQHMVYVSSKATRFPRKLWSIYGASKAAIDHFARSIACEYSVKRDHITSLVIHPPAMDTDMRRSYIKKQPWWFWLWDWIIVHLLRQRKIYHPDLVAWKILHVIESRKIPSGNVWQWE